MTEIIDEVAVVLFEDDYRKYDTETEKLIAMSSYWEKRADIHSSYMKFIVEKRQLQSMNMNHLADELSISNIKGSDFRSWQDYLRRRVQTMISTHIHYSGSYKIWDEQIWRLEAISQMTKPVKRLGKLKSQGTKYDHKGKEPNDRSLMNKIISILIIILTLHTQPTSSFKILQPNQHISSDFKSGNVALCEMTPGSMTHANMNDSNLHKIMVNDWTVINDITKRHIFAIPITRAQDDMTFDLMEPGIGMSVECYNGFRICNKNRFVS